MAKGRISLESTVSYLRWKLSQNFPNLSKRQICRLLAETLIKNTVIEEITISSEFIVENQPELLGKAVA